MGSVGVVVLIDGMVVDIGFVFIEWKVRGSEVSNYICFFWFCRINCDLFCKMGVVVDLGDWL